MTKLRTAVLTFVVIGCGGGVVPLAPAYNDDLREQEGPGLIDDDPVHQPYGRIALDYPEGRYTPQTRHMIPVPLLTCGDAGTFPCPGDPRPIDDGGINLEYDAGSEDVKPGNGPPCDTMPPQAKTKWCRDGGES